MFKFVFFPMILLATEMTYALNVVAYTHSQSMQRSARAHHYTKCEAAAKAAGLKSSTNDLVKIQLAAIPKDLKDQSMFIVAAVCLNEQCSDSDESSLLTSEKLEKEIISISSRTVGCVLLNDDKGSGKLQLKIALYKKMPWFSLEAFQLLGINYLDFDSLKRSNFLVPLNSQATFKVLVKQLE